MNRPVNKIVTTLIHAAVWIGLFSLPFVFGLVMEAPTPPLDAGFLELPLQMITLFYLNYLLLINKLLFNNKLALFIVINIVFIAAFTLPEIYFHDVPCPRPWTMGVDRPERPPNLPLIVGIALNILVVGMSVAIKMTNKWYEARQRVGELEQANTQAELQQLKSQLNPHFLFNSLNNIYALIAFNPEKAQLALHNLCGMLRHQLYEANRETIPLEKEIGFVNSYCDLMKLRVADNVTVNVNLPNDCPASIAVAPLLFVSIVENAFKHGISQSEQSYIGIKISIENGTVICTVRNSYFPKNDTTKVSSGIGLGNLRRRLDLLYPARHTLSVEQKGSEFVVYLSIKYDTLHSH